MLSLPYFIPTHQIRRKKMIILSKIYPEPPRLRIQLNIHIIKKHSVKLTLPQKITQPHYWQEQLRGYT